MRSLTELHVPACNNMCHAHSQRAYGTATPRRFFYAGALPLLGVLIMTGLLTMPAKQFVPLSVRIDVGLAWFASLSTLILVPTDIANALQVCRAEGSALRTGRACAEEPSSEASLACAGDEASPPEHMVACCVLVWLCCAVHGPALSPGARLLGGLETRRALCGDGARYLSANTVWAPLAGVLRQRGVLLDRPRCDLPPQQPRFLCCARGAPSSHLHALACGLLSCT